MFCFFSPPIWFGVCPLCFPKIHKALVKHWREQGIRIFTYLDDGVGAGKSYATASEASNFVKGDIAASGFIAHPEKCCWKPTQVGDLLGFTLNLKEGSIHVPPECIARLRERITLVSNGNPTARLAAGLVGTWCQCGLPSVLSVTCEPGPCTGISYQQSSGHSASLSPPRQLGKLNFGRTAFLVAMVDQFGTQSQK